MFIHKVTATAFKPFASLEVTIDDSPRLVMACGMNGSGKSSLIDAISLWRQQQHWGMSDPGYYSRGGQASGGQGSVQLEFHGDLPGDPRSAVHVRTAQRVTVEFSIGNVGQPKDPLEDPGPRRSIDLDTRVDQNYRDLIGRSVVELWDRAHPRMNTAIIDELVGSIRDPLARLLPGFVFEGPGSNPLADGTFEFTKGGIERYAYKLLSGGEKAVFDLLLDFAVARSTFTNAIYCVDEPELHVNGGIHGPLLDEMLNLLPAGCQLVLATHSAGVMARARDIGVETPGSVAFLDFDGHDFSQHVDLAPSRPDRAFWRRQLEIAFGGFADLLAPAEVILCEGDPSPRNNARARFDSKCYTAIFGDEVPDTSFLSVGNSHDVEQDRLQVGDGITAIVDGVKVVRLVDRDSKDPREIETAHNEGLRVLRHRHLESYLLANDILEALCNEHGRPGQAHALILARDEAMAYAHENQGVAVDDLKRVRGATVTAARRLLSIPQGGGDQDAFLLHTLAPLVAPGTTTYEELREDVFGTPAQATPAPGAGA